MGLGWIKFMKLKPLIGFDIPLTFDKEKHFSGVLGMLIIIGSKQTSSLFVYLSGH